MKHLVCIYILLFALAMPHLNSCQRANTRQELERVDSLLECVPMDTNAITELLDKVGAKPNELSHNDSMYYVMLKHDYLIKRFYRLNNDSMMRQAVRHYDKHGTAYDKMRAHYILACMLYDDMKFKESQKECFTATQYNDTTTLRSIKLLGKCYMLLGGISKKQSDYEIIRQSYEKAAYYAKKIQDSCTLSDCYGHLVDYYRRENNYDMVFKYAQKTYNLYMKLGLEDDAYEELLPMTEVCLQKKDYAKADFYLKEFERKKYYPAKKSNNLKDGCYGSYYAYKGKYYLALGMVDSALICYYNELDFKNEISIPYIYQELANAYSIKNQTDSVNKYLRLYIATHEKADSLETSNNLHDGFYIHENEMLKKQNEMLVNDRWYYHFTSPISIVILILTLCLLAYLCIKNRKTISRMTNHFFFMLYVFKQSLAEQENGTLKYLFGLKKTKIPTIDIEKIKKDIACLIDEEKPIKDQAIWNGLYFYMQANDWHFLDFLESFSGSINKRDIQLCILIRLGYSPSDLAILLLISKQNVTKIRAKLAGILFNEDGKSSKNFDNLIRNFQGKP